jgi:hypothetical protein
VATETRIIRQIDRAEGALTNKAGKTVPVRFSLTQTQAIIGGIPSLRSAQGTLEFASNADADLMFSSRHSQTLKGGGIEAEVFVISYRSFKVTGPIKDAK